MPAPSHPRSPGRRLLSATASVLVLAAGVASCGGGDEPAAAPNRERKVTVAGDSLSVGLGAELRSVLEGGPDPDEPGAGGGTGAGAGTGDGGSADRSPVVKVIGESGSGLARPDVFDWPERLRTLARDFPPSVLVFSVGSNDAQDLTDTSGETVVTMAEDGAWDAEYASRLAEVFDAFEASGTDVVWVGHGRGGDERAGEANRRIHRLATQVASSRPWVQVEDFADLLGSVEDIPPECLLEDGIHLSRDCHNRAARALADRLEDRLDG